MVPTMKWAIVLLIGAVNAGDEVNTFTLSPGDADPEGVTVNYGDSCATQDDHWYLDETSIDEWAIELELDSPYALSSSGVSTLSFKIDGQKVTDEGDLYMGFGDGQKYIAFGVDFDGGIQNLIAANRVYGLQIYPSCSSGDRDLGSGDVASILSASESTVSTKSKKLRDALAGGTTHDRQDWTQFGGQELVNGDTWPVTIEIVNDVENDEVTFRFKSDVVVAECVYSDHFDVDDGKFVVGLMADGGNNNKDDFQIHEVTVTTTKPSTVAWDLSYSTNSLSGSVWSNEGTLGSDYNIESLTGTVEGDTVNGRDMDVLCFDSSDGRTFINYDIGADVSPDLTMEAWFKWTDNSAGTIWMLSADDTSKPYWDRAFILRDTRDTPTCCTSGFGIGAGWNYESTVDELIVGEWSHVAVAYDGTNGEATVYVNGGTAEGGSQQTITTQTEGDAGHAFISLNGGNWDHHTPASGCFAEIKITRSALTADEIASEYRDGATAPTDEAAVPIPHRGASDVSVLQSGEAQTVSAEQSVAESAGSESSFSLQIVIGVAAFGMGAISVLALLALKKRVQQKAAMKPAQEEQVPEVSVSAVPETTITEMAVAIEMEAKQETV